MFQGRFVGGAAPPPGWSVDAVLRAEREGGSVSVLDYSDKDSNLVENLLDTKSGWMIRDQGPRGTCNAFAVVAAEELVRSKRDGHKPFQLFSEEHLYAAMRAIPPDWVGLQANAKSTSFQDRTGTTFLAQAARALTDIGLCRRELMPYRKDRLKAGFVVKNRPFEADNDAAQRRLEAREITHNIVEIDAPVTSQLDIRWKTPLNGTVADLFVAKLKQGLPVVAAFAIVSNGGVNAWFGPEARQFGKVRYPSSDRLAGAEAARGHTVCLVGFVPAKDSASEGWFLIRNSVGRPRFGWEATGTGKMPRALAPGYGYIPVATVNLFCWEYLVRTDPDSAIPRG
ncbi:MAG: hypothetical protein KDK24_17755 [Pseudooceanicola sp.]|nr:hypothetical protein [Pseudooceanicola sp.]